MKLNYRPDTDGLSASAINEVTCLTKNNYEEELVCNIEANLFKNLNGTHHMHSNGRVTVFNFIETTSLQ